MHSISHLMSNRGRRMAFLIVLLVFIPITYANKSICYLEHYGYIEKNAMSDDSGIRLFQENYGLTVDGTFNSETLQLMAEPRCGNKDELLPFSVNLKRKWRTNTITWNMPGGAHLFSIVEQAFDLWARHSNLIFLRDANEPTILLVFSRRKHYYYAKHTPCSSDFDGPGGVLAHAYVPESDTNQTDIHFDREEPWDYSMALTSTSFFITLVHEIGHALGLDHSFDPVSVMYPIFIMPRGISNLNEYDLGIDDIRAIQFLYNSTVPSPTSSPTTTLPVPTTLSTFATSTSPVVSKPKDICNYDIKTFLVIRNRLYAFYDNLVWILSLDRDSRTSKEYSRPKSITDWLPFLPTTFKNISAVYQRPNGEIAMFIGYDIYFIEFPSLRLMRKNTLNSVTGRQVTKLNAVLAGNTGKSYIFVDDSYLYELNECTYQASILGAVSQSFAGIPDGIVAATRYINGNLYFFTGTNVLEFNEFRGTVLRSYSSAFDAFELSCVRETLLNQLYNVLNFLKYNERA